MFTNNRHIARHARVKRQRLESRLLARMVDVQASMWFKGCASAMCIGGLRCCVARGVCARDWKSSQRRVGVAIGREWRAIGEGGGHACSAVDCLLARGRGSVVGWCSCGVGLRYSMHERRGRLALVHGCPAGVAQIASSNMTGGDSPQGPGAPGAFICYRCPLRYDALARAREALGDAIFLLARIGAWSCHDSRSVAHALSRSTSREGSCSTGSTHRRQMSSRGCYALFEGLLASRAHARNTLCDHATSTHIAAHTY